MRITAERIGYLLIALIAFFLPIKTTWSNTALIILLILTAFELIRKGGRWKWVVNRRFYLNTSIILIIPLILGLLYAPDLDKGVAQIVKSLFYLLTPIILLRKDFKRHLAVRYFGWGLCIGASLALAYLFIQSSIWTRFLEGGIRSVLSYGAMGKSFVKAIPEMHPVYFGSYIMIALGYVWLTPIEKFRVVKGALTLLYLSGILFLNSRIVMLASVLLVIY
ncbi:MAG: hypothetical protein HKN89_06640, partial [Eudoraea sp.]|nr:hypothetical protein [Eudoraea sp.]